MIYVPFVALPYYKTNDWINCYLNFVKELSDLLDVSDIEKLESIISINLDDAQKMDRIKYTYRLVTYILSVLYGELVESEAQVSFSMLPENSIYFTFGKDVGGIISSIINKLSTMHKDSIDNLFNQFQTNKYDTIFSCTVNDIFVEQIKILLNNGKTTLTAEVSDNLIQSFISKVHEENEKMALNLEQRLQGAFLHLLIKELKNAFSPTNTQEKYFLSTLISKWDNGEANYKIDICENESCFFVGGCIIDGEQAYHANLNIDIFDKMNYFYEAYRKSRECLSDTILEYRKMISYAKDTRILKSDDMEKILKYVEKNKSFVELRSLYPETFHSDAVKNCLLNY